MKIKFDIDILQHETTWNISKDTYSEIICISKNKIVSFTIYWYHSEEHKIYLRNLFVSKKYRNRGFASSIIDSIQTYCNINNKILLLECNDTSWILKWYKSIGFKKLNKIQNWLIYKGKKI